MHAMPSRLHMLLWSPHSLPSRVVLPALRRQCDGLPRGYVQQRDRGFIQLLLYTMFSWYLQHIRWRRVKFNVQTMRCWYVFSHIWR